MQQGLPGDEIIIQTQGHAGLIRLNRPKAINSLNEAMVSGMKAGLDAFARNSDVTCVILSGEGERGLCAGGDVRQIYAVKSASPEDRTRFWREEFPLNYTISHYPKPYVALMDGIVMGGGVGISAHGRYRIVTERTRLAMPETAIGYFPDVGATWLLARAPGEAGTWLGLTGREIGAADVGAVVESFSSKPDADGILAPHQRRIDAAFGFDTIEEIIDALVSAEDSFVKETLSTLQLRSPTSLKLTLRLLRLGRGSSGLVECLEREFAAGCEVLRNHDFYEGVRAALIDKDRNPKWSPATLDEVSDEELDRYCVSTEPPLFRDHRL